MTGERDDIARLTEAVDKLCREHPLPRCVHGRALQDHAGDTLTCPDGCTMVDIAHLADLLDRFKLASAELSRIDNELLRYFLPLVDSPLQAGKVGTAREVMSKIPISQAQTYLYDKIQRRMG